MLVGASKDTGIVLEANTEVSVEIVAWRSVCEGPVVEDIETVWLIEGSADNVADKDEDAPCCVAVVPSTDEAME